MTFNVNFKTASFHLGTQSFNQSVEDRGYYYFYKRAKIGLAHLDEARKQIKVLYPNWQPTAENIVLGLKNEFEKTLQISEQDARLSGLFENRNFVKVEIEAPHLKDLLADVSDLFEPDVTAKLDESNNPISVEVIYRFDWVCILDIWFRNGMPKKLTLDMFR
jgi:hypothetical protein